MEKIILQISKIAACEGVSIGSMEKKIGASKGVLARAIANGTDIQAKWVQLIAENYPRYSAEWLLTGEGAMLKGEREPQPVSEPPTAEPEVVEVLRQQLAEKDRQIAEKDRQLAERDKQTGILLRMLSAQKTPEKSPIGGV